MFRISLLLTLSLLFLASGVSCIDPSGASVVSVMPGCGAQDTSSLTIDSTESGGNGSNLDDFDGPISLPVTISKNDAEDIPTVDPITVDFQSAGVSGAVSDSRDLSASSDTTIGTVFFYLNEALSCNTVGVVMDGTFIGTLAGDATNNCRYDHTISGDMLDKIVTYVPFGPTTTIDDGGPVGYPLSVRINSPSGLVEDYAINAFVTILDNTGNNADMLADIQETSTGFIEISDEPNFIYPALSGGDEPALWVSPLHGGFPEEFVTTTVLVETIEEIDTDVFVIDSNDDINRLFGDASTESLVLDNVSTDIHKGTFATDASNTYLAYETDIVDQGKSFAIYEIATGITYTPADLIGSDLFVPTSFEMDWIGQSQLAVVVTDGTTYQILTADIADLVNGLSNTITFTRIVTLDRFIGRPVVVNGLSSKIFYLCTDTSGITNICRYDFDTTTFSTEVSLSENIDSYDLANDGQSFIIYEAGGVIGLYQIETRSSASLTFGRRPSISVYDDQAVAYFEDMGDTSQVGIYNLNDSYFEDAAALSINPGTVTMAMSSRKNFYAEGGEPPYTFTVQNGSGTILPTLGTYYTDETAGSSVVNVTDSVGNSTTVTVTIANHGARDASFAVNGIASIGSTTRIFDSILQKDGKLIVCGDVLVGGNRNYYIARLNVDGSFDSLFGTNGVVTYDSGGTDDSARAITLQKNGKVIVAGQTNGSQGQYDVTLIMLDLSGQPNAAIGTGGVRTITLANSNETVTDMLSYKTDTNPHPYRYVVSGYSTPTSSATGQDVMIMRINGGGELDTDFSGDGVYTFDVSAKPDKAYAIGTAGKDTSYYYVVGEAQFGNSTTSHCFAAKISSTGVVDTSVGGTGGFVEFAIGATDRASSCNALSFDTDGSKLIIGATYNKSPTLTEMAALRLSTKLKLDTSFNSTGVVKIAGNSVISGSVKAVATSGTDYFLAGSGGSFTKPLMTVVKLQSDGQPSTSFGTNGMTSYNLVAVSASEEAVIFVYDSSNKVYYFGGTAVLGDASTLGVVSRFWR